MRDDDRLQDPIADAACADAAAALGGWSNLVSDGAGEDRRTCNANDFTDDDSDVGYSDGGTTGGADRDSLGDDVIAHVVDKYVSAFACASVVDTGPSILMANENRL